MNQHPDKSHCEELTSFTDIPEICAAENYNDTEAKQRASVLWLLSKAYMPKIPSELYEPCYRDHEGNDRLKPQIVHALANAELYCLALANIYADPNYHNLNHHGILQVLMRKGVEVIEPHDCSLTETVLVQTAPIRMSAHMAVIEGIMALFIKEVLIPEKVMEVVCRYSIVDPENEMPYDCEEAALLWINKSCIKMRHKIEEELGMCYTPDDPESSPVRRRNVPTIALAQDLGDLSDGCCLAALLSLYCPKYFRWQDIRLHDPMSLADSVYNLQLVQKFCLDHLPQDIYCLTLEDMVHLHPSVMQNVLAVIADLLYIFEIRPPKYICRPGVREEEVPKVVEALYSVNQNGQRQSPLQNCRLRNYQHSISPIPDLRSGAYGSGDAGRMSPRSNGGSWQRHPQKSLSARRISAPDEKKLEGNRTLRRTHSVNFSEMGRHGEKVGDLGPLHSSSSTFIPSHQRYHIEEDEELAGYFSPQYHQFQHSLIDQEENRRTRAITSDNAYMPQNHYQVFHTPNPLNDDSSPGHLDVLKEYNELGSRWPQHSVEEHDPQSQKSPSYQVHHHSPSRQDSIKTVGYPKQRSLSDIHLSLDKRTGRSHTNNQQFENCDQPPGTNQDLKSSKDIPEENKKNRSVDSPEKLSSPRRNSADFLIFEDRVGGVRNRPLSGGHTWRKSKDLFSKTDWNKENLRSENNEQQRGNIQDLEDQMNTISFADLSKQRNNSNSAINIVYTQQEKEHISNIKKPVRPGYLHINTSQSGMRNSSPISPYSSMTQWPQEKACKLDAENIDASVASQMHDIRLKLEEKRKRIEQEKMRLENLSKKQREKVGKTAFLKAVKGGISNTGIPDSQEEFNINSQGTSNLHQNKNFTIDDITEDLDSVRRKWLERKVTEQDKKQFAETDENGEQPEDFQASIEQLNFNLTDLQSDISRLTQQQEVIQKMLRNNNQVTPQKEPPQTYYLHDQSTSAPQNNRVSKWMESTSNLNASQFYPLQVQPVPPDSPHIGRGHWGQPVMPFSNIQQQQPSALPNPAMWQPPPPHTIKPSSVDPQVLTSQPPAMPGHYYDRPSSAVPFSNTNLNQGFSLHQQQQLPYGMTISHANTFTNDPPNAYYQGQYPFGMYQQQQQQPNFNMIQNPYMNTMCDNQASLQNQSSGFHLHHSSSMSYIQNSGHNIPQSPDQGNVLPKALTPPLNPNSRISKSQSQCDFSNQVEDSSNLIADDFGRPLKTSSMQHSPPNRPMLGKTFRVPKPKIMSPSSPNSIQQHVPFPSPCQPEQALEPQGFPSPDSQNTNDKGFYVSFDNDQPRKPKPKLKPKHLKTRNQMRKADLENEVKKMEHGNYDGLSKNNNYTGFPERQQQYEFKEDDDDAKSGNLSYTCEVTDGKTGSEGSVLLSPGVGFVIGSSLVEADPDKEIEMTRRKEMIMMMSLRRRAEQEAKKNAKQQEYLQIREKERVKRERQDKKKEEEKLRRQLILEQYRQRKAKDDAEDGISSGGGAGGSRDDRSSTNRGATFTRPKSSIQLLDAVMNPYGCKYISHIFHSAASFDNVLASGVSSSAITMLSLIIFLGSRSASATRTKSKGGQASIGKHHDTSSPSSLDSPVGRGSQYNLAGGYQDDVSSEHSYTPSPRRTQMYPHSSPISPTSYPSSPAPLFPGMLSSGRSRGTPSDGLSDTSSTISSAWASEYTGPKLFVKPATKSNRGIVTNAVNTVLAGAVNSETKKKVLEEIDRSDGKHFLILFRDAGCQFRALYSYNPETEEVMKLYGIGPRVVTDKMMDRFYKYNSGGKSFTQIHTKHLTATIDAFTIQNSLWQGKRAMPVRRDYL